MAKLKNKRIKASTICGAVVAAALFTPVPAIADVAPQVSHLLRRSAHAAAQTTAQPAEVSLAAATTPLVTGPRQSTPDLALSLISAGTIGLGLSLGGLVLVTARRRQY